MKKEESLPLPIEAVFDGFANLAKVREMCSWNWIQVGHVSNYFGHSAVNGYLCMYYNILLQSPVFR